MKNLPIFSYFFTIIILVLVLTACPSTEAPRQTRDVRRLVGTAVTPTKAAYNGSAEALFITNERLENVLQVGSISSIGEVDVTLPEILPDTLLRPLTADFLPETEDCEPRATLTASDPNTLFKDIGGTFTGLATSSEQVIYELDSETPAFPEDANALNFVPLPSQQITFVVKFYVDRDVDIQGTCTLIDEDDVEGITFRGITLIDLELKRGWNEATLVVEIRELEGGRVIENRTTVTTGVVSADTILVIFPAD